MSHYPDAVLGLVGYTKCRKSTVARQLRAYCDFTVFEMSTLIRERIERRGGRMTVHELVSEVNAIRQAEGSDALARHVASRIVETRSKFAVVAGLRSYDDHAHLKRTFECYRAIFLHTAPDLRHNRLRVDPTSIAKTNADFAYLDRQAWYERITDIASEIDYVLVCEPGFPLTPLEQLRVIVDRLSADLGVALPWRSQHGTSEHGGVMSDQGFSVTRLPVFEESLPDGAPLVHRLLKRKGELSTLSVSPMNYLAYVEFPPDGIPRANHFHEEKEEFLYLIKGRLRGYFRRGGLTDDEPKVVEIEAGSLIHISPGWGHAYVTLEEGFGVEFSPTDFEIIQRDKVRDHLVPEER